MDDVVPRRSYTEGPVQWLVIRGTASFLRCTARIRTRAAAVLSALNRSEQRHFSAWPQSEMNENE